MLLSIYPEVELLHHVVIPFFCFLRITIALSIVAASFCFPTNILHIRAAASPHSHRHLLISIHLIVAITVSMGYEVVSHCSFDLNFPNEL